MNHIFFIFITCPQDGILIKKSFSQHKVNILLKLLLRIFAKELSPIKGHAKV